MGRGAQPPWRNWPYGGVIAEEEEEEEEAAEEEEEASGAEKRHASRALCCLAARGEGPKIRFGSRGAHDYNR